MLKLHNVTVSLQDMGNVLLVFLQGQKEDVEGVYFSLYNHGATSAEFQEMSDSCGYVVIHGSGDGELAYIKLRRALVFGALAEILNKENTKGQNPFDRAVAIAEERFNSIERVHWYKPVADLGDIYTMGDSVRAERDTGNFDDVLEMGVKGELVSPVAEPEPSIDD